MRRQLNSNRSRPKFKRVARACRSDRFDRPSSDTVFQPPLFTGAPANAGARSLRLTSLLLLAGVFVGGRIQPAEAVCAADNCWTGTTSADWFLGTNWSTTTVPTSATNV